MRILVTVSTCWLYANTLPRRTNTNQSPISFYFKQNTRRAFLVLCWIVFFKMFMHTEIIWWKHYNGTIQIFRVIPYPVTCICIETCCLGCNWYIHTRGWIPRIRYRCFVCLSHRAAAILKDVITAFIASSVAHAALQLIQRSRPGSAAQVLYLSCIVGQTGGPMLFLYHAMLLYAPWHLSCHDKNKFGTC